MIPTHDEPQQKSKPSELIAACAAVAAVFVSLLGAVINVWQTREVSARQQRMAQQTDITTRYSAIARDAGSAQQMTRESALYATRDLARDNPTSCREAIQLLAAYLRWTNGRSEFAGDVYIGASMLTTVTT